MSEQLSLDLMQAPSIDNSTPELVDSEIIDSNNNDYEALDYQLAQLLQQQNGKTNQTLKEHTLAISKHTREGQIFIACSADDKTELLNTHVVGVTGDYKPLILDNDYLYLNRYFSYQQQLADNISKRRLISDKPIPEWLEKRLTHYFAEDTKLQSKSDLKENESINWQQKATELTLKQPFLVLSGGPGTGKTTTVSRILALLQEQHAEVQHQNETNEGATYDKKLRILLAAPTGKAAIRLLDSLKNAQNKLGLPKELSANMPTQASTLHKLLGYQPNSTQFKHHSNNPLPADVVIIDEASMIDIAMMAKLLDAIPVSATLILVGDKDQLSSVEIGSVFSDICHGLAGTEHLITLQKNWRFSEHSGIGQLAKAVNNNEADFALSLLASDDLTDCNLLTPTIIDPPQIPKLLIEPWQHYFDLLKQPDATVDEIFDAFNEYRILCALRRGLNGSQWLSDRVEIEIAKLGMLNTKSTGSWYHGRPVMITQNSYSKGLFNGDTGIALLVDNQLNVYFPDNSNVQENQANCYKSFAPIRLPVHETTWAMTIHKSQGSEFNQVTLVLPHEVMPLLTKQLVYTGITRAKKRVSIIATDEILKAGIMTEAVTATRIAEKLVP